MSLQWTWGKDGVWMDNWRICHCSIDSDWMYGARICACFVDTSWMNHQPIFPWISWHQRAFLVVDIWAWCQFRCHDLAVVCISRLQLLYWSSRGTLPWWVLSSLSDIDRQRVHHCQRRHSLVNNFCRLLLGPWYHLALPRRCPCLCVGLLLWTASGIPCTCCHYGWHHDIHP